MIIVDVVHRDGIASSKKDWTDIPNGMEYSQPVEPKQDWENKLLMQNSQNEGVHF